MARRKRTLGPYSQSKMTMALTNTLAARMGPLAESPLGQFIVTSAALERTARWYERRQLAKDIYDEAMKYVGRIPPMHNAMVNALASAASKVVYAARTRRLTKDADEVLDDVLSAVQASTGAPDEYVRAVKKAALIALGNLTAAGAQ